ncbi:metal-sulfur cluster biosynthetic enzyme [Rhizobium mongolense]|uniref:Metal-sulfur cluster biosynthetic enzyme n=1 Tax=Rhizobium mongolense TaxID=57676 RepID=A0ABR6IX92_9HYPH|nr:metal-sulfur cluster biosynthetic enzyme [Rhizobium mongolense]
MIAQKSCFACNTVRDPAKIARDLGISLGMVYQVHKGVSE